MQQRKIAPKNIDPTDVLAAVDAYRPPHPLDPLLPIRSQLTIRLTSKAITLAALADILGDKLGKKISPKVVRKWVEEGSNEQPSP